MISLDMIVVQILLLLSFLSLIIQDKPNNPYLKKVLSFTPMAIIFIIVAILVFLNLPNSVLNLFASIISVLGITISFIVNKKYLYLLSLIFLSITLSFVFVDIYIGAKTAATITFLCLLAAIGNDFVHNFFDNKNV